MFGSKVSEERIVIRTQMTIYKGDLPVSFARLQGASQRRQGQILLRLLAEAESKVALAEAIGRAAAALDAPVVAQTIQPAAATTATRASKDPSEIASKRGTLFDELAAMNLGTSAGLGGKS